MACSCHTAALRTFVRTIAQIHNGPALAPKALSHCQSLAVYRPRSRPFPALHTTPAAGPSTRRFQSTTAREGDANPDAVSEQLPESLIEPTPSSTEPNDSDLKQSSVKEAKDGAEELVVPPRNEEPVKHVKKLKLKKQAAKGKLAAEAAERGDPPPMAKKAKVSAEKPKPKAKSKAKGTPEKYKVGAKTGPKPKREQTDIVVERDLAVEESSADKAAQASWGIQKSALRVKFPEGWNPRKKLSPDALAGIRALNEQFPEEYPTEVLAARFEMSPEAIRRILKSKWQPSSEEEEDRQRRWFGRGKRVWAQWAELGKKPPRKWRREGIVRKPFWNEQRTRSGRPRTKEEMEAVKFARAERVQKRISQTLL